MGDKFCYRVLQGLGSLVLSNTIQGPKIGSFIFKVIYLYKYIYALASFSSQ